MFVDLPGYGFAKMGRSQQEEVERFLRLLAIYFFLYILLRMHIDRLLSAPDIITFQLSLFFTSNFLPFNPPILVLIYRSYLEERGALRLAVLLVDPRREAQDLDLGMLQFLQREYIPYVVVATKCDKLGKNELDRSLNALSSSMGLPRELILPFSSGWDTKNTH